MKSIRLKVAVVSGLVAISSVGCETSGKSGALIGAGIGALAGQAIGGDTAGTLIGTAIGSGIGYMIGNEKDKKHAAEMTVESSPPHHSHNEVGPLGGTRWMVVSLAPKDRVTAFASKIIEFRPYGRVITTTTTADGRVEEMDEYYRVVGQTLIIRGPKRLINAAYGISRDELIISADDFRAVLKRIR